MLREFAANAIVDRHEANATLFSLFFEQEDFRARLLDYLSGAYEEIRAEGAG